MFYRNGKSCDIDDNVYLSCMFTYQSSHLSVSNCQPVVFFQPIIASIYRRYAAMLLVLIVPEAVSLIKVFWHTSFIKRTKTQKWPACLAIFVVSREKPQVTYIKYRYSNIYILFTLVYFE